MNERRAFIQLAGLLGLAATATARAADTTTAAPKARGEIARFALGGDLAGKEAVLVDLIARPATGQGGAHRHPGFVLGYVLEGTYAFGINGETPRIIKAGETFFEERGALHSGNASADPGAPAHLLAFMVVPAGEKLVLPA